MIKRLLRLDFEKLIRIISMLLISTAVFYHFVVFLPTIEIDRKVRIEADKKLQEECIRDATNTLQTVIKGVDPVATNQQ